jgi:hydroxymethylbilane synthase
VARPLQELRLGTRGSPLALWQAGAVAARIAEAGGPSCRLVVIKTTGDTLVDRPLSDAGGKRLFVKEIEDALLRNEIDLAVHSSKDMPAVLPGGLTIAGVLPREDPLDAVVLPVRANGLGLRADRNQSLSPQPSALLSGEPALSHQPSAPVGAEPLALSDLIAILGPSPSIGTGSVRRVAQLSRVFPAARFAPIRGNLDTRLRKLDGGDHDALVLAAAGLCRLGMASRIAMTLPASVCVPAPGQGIVAIEIREGDDAVRQIVAEINDADAGAALEAERALVDALGGGCQTPIGALASAVDPGTLELFAAVATLDGKRIVRASARGSRREAAALGASVGRQLIAQGADVILAEAQNRA